MNRFVVEANAYIAVRNVTFENITINRIHELNKTRRRFAQHSSGAYTGKWTMDLKTNVCLYY